MTVTVHIENAKNTTEHNERSKFQLEKTADNLHWDCVKGKMNGLQAGKDRASSNAELDFYTDHFGKAIEEQNQKHIKSRHKERCVTIQQYLEKNPPKEVILQFGSIKDDYTFQQKKSLLIAGVNEVRKEMKKCGLSVISVDVHLDEKSPHCHIRFVGIHNNKVNFNEALKSAGVSLPNPNKPVSSYNNYLMTFTARIRAVMDNMADSKGYSVKSLYRGKKQYHKTTQEYIAHQQAVEKGAELEQRINNIQGEINDLKELIKKGQTINPTVFENLHKKIDGLQAFYNSSKGITGKSDEVLAEVKQVKGATAPAKPVYP